MLIQRLLEAPEKSFFLLGPRGSGKSTWLRAHFPDAHSINLLDEDKFQQLLATAAISADLQIASSGSSFDPNSYKAEITVETMNGYTRTKFKKKGTDGINLYSRIKGQPTFKFVSRDTNSPYDDYTELAVAGQAEVREYQRCGASSATKKSACPATSSPSLCRMMQP